MKTAATLWTMDQARVELGVTDEPIEQYHASAGLSFSGLKQYAKTPAHYRAYRDRQDEETASQRIGTLAHLRLLEPEKFELTVVKNDLNRNTKDFKDFAAAAVADGKYICKTAEYDDVCRMAEGVLRNTTASRLLSGGKPEQSVRWRDPETGVLLKCRPDYLREDGVVVDLKTYEDLGQASVERQILRMLYHWQSSFYLAGINQVLGLNTNMFAHLFIDTKAFVARVVVLEDAALDKAESQIRPLIQQYAAHLKADSWPGYPDEILTVSLPSYAW